MPRLGCYGPNCRSCMAGLCDDVPTVPDMSPVYESARVVSDGFSNLRAPAGGGASWWERLFESGSKAAATIIAARRPAPVVIRTAGMSAKPPGFFANPDGSTNWTRVGLVGAGAAAALLLVTKLGKGR